MAYLVVGYSTKLHNSKFLGIKPCGSCKKFSEQYLARSWFTINLFWFLPIFGFPTGRYLRCKNCSSGYKLTREQWNELKLAAADMPKKKDYRQAYEALKAIVTSASPEDLNVDTIYSRLMSKVECDDNGRHIRELVVTYLQNSQAAAAIINPESQAEAAEALPEPEASPVAEVLPAPVLEAEAPAVTRSAEAAPAVESAPIQGSVAAPYIAQQYNAAAPARSERSKKRLLWLIPAFLLLPVALFFLLVMIFIFADPDPDMFVNVLSTIFCLIPGALDILFFALALKKYKK